MIDTVLFDLDGTLLPMDMDVFLRSYLGGLARRVAPVCGYDPKALVAGIMAGTEAMIRNDGKKSNEDVFWDAFEARFAPKDVRGDMPHFDAFYREDFDRVAEVCGRDPRAIAAVRELKRRGYRVILATNPLFPAVATEARIRWAGLEPEDFEFYTTYENSCHCKPNPAYYRDVLDRAGVSPERCIMVGNDTSDDVAAEKLGIPVFLITACLYDREGKDISGYPQGDFDDLLAYLGERE